jgi:hypothetical protein
MKSLITLGLSLIIRRYGIPASLLMFERALAENRNTGTCHRRMENVSRFQRVLLTYADIFELIEVKGKLKPVAYKDGAC